MIRVALDSNALVDAEFEPESPKGALARRAIEAAAVRSILAVPTLLESIAVVRRKCPQSLPSAFIKVSAWSSVFETASITRLAAEQSLTLVRDHGFQVWDAVIWSAARSAGADILLSEDLQDGLQLNGMRALDPFAASSSELDEILNT